MTQWRERATGRLRNGESVVTTVPVGGNGVVVTSQRLMAFTPESDGPNYRAVERPNVEDVRLETVGDEDWLEYVFKGGIGGLVGVAVGLTVDFGSLLSVGSIDTSGAGQVGVGGMLAILERITQLLGSLDDVFLYGGLLAFAAGLAALGKYVESRDHTLTVEVAGDDPVRVLAPKGSDDALARVQRSLRESDADEREPASESEGSDPLDPRADY